MKYLINRLAAALFGPEKLEELYKGSEVWGQECPKGAMQDGRRDFVKYRITNRLTGFVSYRKLYSN